MDKSYLKPLGGGKHVHDLSVKDVESYYSGFFIHTCFLSATFISSYSPQHIQEKIFVLCNFHLNHNSLFSFPFLVAAPYFSPRHTFPFPSLVQHNSFPLSLQFILGSVFTQPFSSLSSLLTSLHLFRNLFPSQHFLPCFDPSFSIRVFSFHLPCSSSLLSSEDILDSLSYYYFRPSLIFLRLLHVFEL